MAETLEIPLFPLNAVLFPTTRLPLRIFEERYKRLYEDSLKKGGRFGIVLIRDGAEAGGPLPTPFDVGTLAEIESVDHHGDAIFILSRGTQRFRIGRLEKDRPYLVAKVRVLPESTKATRTETEAAQALQRRFDEYLEKFRAFAAAMGGDLVVPASRPDLTVHERVFAIAQTLPLELSQKQALLETEDLGEFILALSRLLEGEASFLRADPEDPSVA